MIAVVVDRRAAQTEDCSSLLISEDAAAAWPRAD